uniref:Uncharacterized protein n=1 Tax=Arundo donax TaxID=35708 RepID=A0A0A9H9I3_ARUDO
MIIREGKGIALLGADWGPFEEGGYCGELNCCDDDAQLLLLMIRCSL